MRATARPTKLVQRATLTATKRYPKLLGKLYHMDMHIYTPYHRVRVDCKYAAPHV